MTAEREEEDLIYLMRNARSVARQLSSEVDADIERPVSLRVVVVASLVLFGAVAAFTWYPELSGPVDVGEDVVSPTAGLDWSYYPLPEGHPFRDRLTASKELVQGLYDRDISPELRVKIRADLEQWPLADIAASERPSSSLLSHLIVLCRFSGDASHRPFLDAMMAYDHVAVPRYARYAIQKMEERFAFGADNDGNGGVGSGDSTGHARQ